MKIPLYYFVILLLSPLTVTAYDTSIRQYPLDEYMVHEVPVTAGDGVTTFLFPGKISSLYAAKVSADLKTRAEFQISYEPGHYYFTIRANAVGATDVLTVIFDRKAYLIKLRAVTDNPVLSATFYRATREGQRGAVVTPSKLLSLLDKAKLYYQFAQHYPEDVAQVEHQRPARIMEYRDFDVLIDDVWRYNAEDTVVFRVLLRNNTDAPIEYEKQDIAVRVGARIYPASVVDASGVMPPLSVTPAYFAVTGSPDGGRNNLRADNKWNVLVPRKVSVSGSLTVSATATLLGK